MPKERPPVTKQFKIPPDDDGPRPGGEMHNDARARWAEQALCEFCNQTHQSPKYDGWREIIQDFLTDLGHFCDRHGDEFASACGEPMNLRAMIEAASETYDGETCGEGTQYE